MEYLQKKAYLFLRISFGIYFLWVGILKLFAVSTSLDLLLSVLPATFTHVQLFSFLIAAVEILLGISYLANRFDRIASIVMIVTVLFVSLPVFFLKGFDPRFPVLSLAGEYVLKNLILISGGLVLLSEKSPIQNDAVHAIDKKSAKDH